MSASHRKQALALLVCLLALWPAVHLWLSARYEIDPWELFGWGMYALPSPQVHIRLEQLVDSRPLIVRPSDETRALLDELARARTRFGQLVSLEDTASRILTHEPQMQGIVLVVRRWHLDRETANFDFTEERHRFDRHPQKPDESIKSRTSKTP
jgi:hypothetical protein